MAPTLLTIQSHVVYGHVGNSAAVFPLQRLGCEVWPIHTVQFSSHAGYPGWRGRAFDAALIDDCVAGIAAIGALGRCDGVLSGYLGKAEIGEAALRAFAAVKAANPRAAYACDPVIGDEGRGVYVEPPVAEFLRERALPAATVLTPNAFELSLLAGWRVGDVAQLSAALTVLRARGPQVILVTSLTLADTPADAIDMIVCEGGELWRLRTPKLPIAVNGAGDLVAALFFFHWLRSGSGPQALASAASSVYGVVAATAAAGARELQIVAAQEELVRPTRLFRPERL
ncbi:MAG: pyridoxal kinase PdxY [Roseiarcus sp.]|jgi:pyridoxine kinase